MRGTNTFRQINLAVSAAVVAAAVLLQPMPVIAETGLRPQSASPREQVARLLIHEQSALKVQAAARITQIVGGPMPARRGQLSDTVSIASRNLIPGAEVQSSAVPPHLDLPNLDAMPSASGDSQWQCLAEAIYFESRGEPLEGQIGVAEVVLNRVDSRAYPGTICDVTRQGVGTGRACQFSYACDGRPETMTSRLARDRAGKLAAVMIAGRARTVTDGATHFHATYVRPGWTGRMFRTASIGHHVFYRAPTRVASR